MKNVIINDVNYGELVKVAGTAFIDRFYAEMLGLEYVESAEAHSIITDVYLDCELGRRSISIFVLKKEDFLEAAKLFSTLASVGRVAIQSKARNLVVFQNGVQVGEVKTLDQFYTNISEEMLELTNFE